MRSDPTSALHAVPSELCESASCGEVFLLASAALANITFFDSMACEILLQLNAIQILLQACRDRQRVDTPYSKDQVHGWLSVSFFIAEKNISEVPLSCSCSEILQLFFYLRW